MPSGPKNGVRPTVADRPREAIVVVVLWGAESSGRLRMYPTQFEGIDQPAPCTVRQDPSHDNDPAIRLGSPPEWRVLPLGYATGCRL